MRIALITTNQMDIGIRTLSGILKESGHETVLINLSSREDYYPLFYSRKIKDELSNIIRDCDIVGISISDLFLLRSKDLAYYIKYALHKKIIFGGIHAQLYPDECIKTDGVDAICIGEGVKTIKSLITSSNCEEVCIDDFWIKRQDGSINKGNLLPMLTIEEMHMLPLPDYTYDDYWLLNQDHETIELIKDRGGCYKIEQHQVGHADSFVASFMLGCINKCSYCNITALSTKWRIECPENKWYRIKPNEIIFKELDMIKVNNPNMKFMCIMDNDFAARSVRDIKEFFEYYKKNIGLPIYLMASPNTLNEEKLKFMVDGGLKEINIGIESNECTNISLYDRHISDEAIIEKAFLINKYIDKIYPFYDLLIFNRAETNKSLLKTIELIRKLPLPFDLVPHHLTLGSEVPLYKYFKSKGLETNSRQEKVTTSNYHEFDFEEYSNWETFYLNLIIEWSGGAHNALYCGRIPRKLNDLMANPVFKDFVTKHPVKISDNQDTFEYLISPEIINSITNDIGLLRYINIMIGNITFSNH